MKIYKTIISVALFLVLVLPMTPVKSFIHDSEKTLVIDYKINSKCIYKISYLR